MTKRRKADYVRLGYEQAIADVATSILGAAYASGERADDTILDHVTRAYRHRYPAQPKVVEVLRTPFGDIKLP